MDEYSSSGPKSYKSEANRRAREMERQMKELSAIPDETTLRDVLLRDYSVDAQHPRFPLILQSWRELRQRRP